jgi:hypothetical protein
MQMLFEQSRKDDSQQQEEKIALLYQQIGPLQFELDWLGAPGSKKNGQTTRLASCASRSNPASQFPFSSNVNYWDSLDPRFTMSPAGKQLKI